MKQEPELKSERETLQSLDPFHDWNVKVSQGSGWLNTVFSWGKGTCWTCVSLKQDINLGLVQVQYREHSTEQHSYDPRGEEN